MHISSKPLTMGLVLWLRQRPRRLLFPSFRLHRKVESRLPHIRYLSASAASLPTVGCVDKADSLLAPGPKDVAIDNVSSRFNESSRGRGIPRPPNRTLTTLDPKQLDRGCFLDISNKKNPNIYTSSSNQEPPFCIIYKRVAKQRTLMPFPAGTKGFLYYHTNAQKPVESQIRFRVTEDNDPISFFRGHDLLYDKGYVWHIRLAHILSDESQPMQQHLLRLLVHDGLVDRQAISDVPNLNTRRCRRARRFISSLSEPFVLDLSLYRPMVTVLAAGRRHTFEASPPQVIYRSRKRLYNGGAALVRFERWTHVGQRVVGMRLLKILETPKQVPHPPPLADTTFPAEGELFTDHGHIWYRLVDRSKELKVLCDAEDGDDGQEL